MRSCKALTRREASELLDALGRPLPHPPGRSALGERRAEASARHAPTPPSAADNVVGLATPAQRALIAELAERVEWRIDGGYDAWLRASHGLSAVRTDEEARDVIEALKAMARRAGAVGLKAIRCRKLAKIMLA